MSAGKKHRCSEQGEVNTPELELTAEERQHFRRMAVELSSEFYNEDDKALFTLDGFYAALLQAKQEGAKEEREATDRIFLLRISELEADVAQCTDTPTRDALGLYRAFLEQSRTAIRSRSEGES